MPEGEGERLLTTGELAKALGVSASAILKWSRADPPLITPEWSTPVGGHHRWLLSEVRAQLKAARKRDE
jgi:hypothetical protein